MSAPARGPLWRAHGFWAGLAVGVTLSAAFAGAWFGGAHWRTHAAPSGIVLTEPPPPALRRASAPVIADEVCARAWRSGGRTVTDSQLYDCAKRGQLGGCHVWAACPTCACNAYAGSESLCDQNGKCGFPLNGTGCVSSAFYGRGNPEFGCEGDEVQVGACMMRRLLRDGYCEKK